jgi:hypothetical protein
VSSSGAVTLGSIAANITMLEVACSRCERHGRLSVGKLIGRGPETKLPELRTIIADDCPRMRAVSVYDRCGVHYPQLVAAWAGRGT